MMKSKNVEFLQAWSLADKAIRMMREYKDVDATKYQEWENIYYEQMAITKSIMRDEFTKSQK